MGAEARMSARDVACARGVNRQLTLTYMLQHELEGRAVPLARSSTQVQQGPSREPNSKRTDVCVRSKSRIESTVADAWVADAWIARGGGSARRSDSQAA